MNNSTAPNLQIDDERLPLVQSYMHWWEMAGFDIATTQQSLDWLETKAKSQEIKTVDSRESVSIKTPNDLNDSKNQESLAKTETAQETQNKSLPQEQWPDTLEAFHKALNENEALPGNIYGETILPRSISPWHNDKTVHKSQTIMLISDFPSPQDVAAKQILSGKENQLIVNMMTACGFDKYNIYCASLCSSRPIYDEIPAEDSQQIHALIRHHIGLVAPKAIISLGSSACHALLGAELMKSRRNLHLSLIHI